MFVSILQMEMRDGPVPSKVSIWMKNVSGESVSVVPPNPYYSVWLSDNDGSMFPRTRAMSWSDTRKPRQIRPEEEIIATINLKNYSHDIDGDVKVLVRFEIIDHLGVSQNQDVEGKVYLNIPTAEEQLAQTRAALKAIREKRRAANQPLALAWKRFDVADSTCFECVSPSTKNEQSA